MNHSAAAETSVTIALAHAARAPLPAARAYYEALKPHASRVDIWHTAYNHVLADAAAIVDKIGDFVAAGVSKFILRPAAKGDDDMLAQTRRLINEVLPLVAARWPKPKRRMAAE